MSSLTWIKGMIPLTNWGKSATKLELVCQHCGRKFHIWTRKPEIAKIIWREGGLCKRCVIEALVRMYFVKWKATGFMLSQRYPGHEQRMLYHKRRIYNAMYTRRHRRKKKKSLARTEEW